MLTKRSGLQLSFDIQIFINELYFFQNQQLFNYNFNFFEIMKAITPNYSEMGSSAGFKKRTLIKPSSTIGIIEKEYLKSIDISQTESSITSVIKNDLSAIQQEINLLDMDKKLRFGQGGLDKNYVTIFKKWLRDSQNNIEKQDDQFKILKFMNVDNLSAGFKKLWKLVSLLDTLITKSNELQVVTFLKYDELFTSLCKDYTPVTKKLANLNKNSTIGGSQSTQIMIQRVQDLFCLVSRIRKNQKNGNLTNETNELIQKLQTQNQRLNSYLQKLNQQVKQNTSSPLGRIENKIINQTQSKIEKKVLDKVSNQITQKYKIQLQETNKKFQNLLNEEAKLKVQIQVLKQKQQLLNNDIKQLKFSKTNMNINENSYQAALLQELQNMKTGYQNKIKKIVQQFSSREFQLKKKQNEYRIENEKVKFERSLLLKKYDLIK